MGKADDNQPNEPRINIKSVTNRLTLTKNILTLAGFKPGTWVLGDELYASVYPYLLKNKDELISLFPDIADTLKKIVGEKSTDRRLVTSFIRRLCRLYKIPFVYKKSQRRINKRVTSIYKYQCVC